MIKFIKVTKQFADDQTALYEVSFEVEEGELVVITGPSGSGKTTLLKLLTKEYEPTSGEIFFKDDDVNKIKGSQIPFLRRKIGAVFQDYKLLPELNVWENIALALSITNRSDSEIANKVTDLLKLVDLEEKAYLFPHQLSGGEAQRISIARALSTAPELIFADEPTGNLDSANSKIIAKLLKKINELGTTVLITTHDPVVLDVLPDARKISLEKGKLTSDSKKKTGSASKKEEDREKDEKEAKKVVVEEVVVETKPDEQKSSTKKSFSFLGISFGKGKGEDKKKREPDQNSDQDQDQEEAVVAEVHVESLEEESTKPDTPSKSKDSKKSKEKKS